MADNCPNVFQYSSYDVLMVFQELLIYRLPPLPPTHLAFDESMFGYSLHWFPRSALLVRLLEDLSL